MANMNFTTPAAICFKIILIVFWSACAYRVGSHVWAKISKEAFLFVLQKKFTNIKYFESDYTPRKLIFFLIALHKYI